MKGIIFLLMALISITQTNGQLDRIRDVVSFGNFPFDPQISISKALQPLRSITYTLYFGDSCSVLNDHFYTRQQLTFDDNGVLTQIIIEKRAHSVTPLSKLKFNLGYRSSNAVDSVFVREDKDSTTRVFTIARSGNSISANACFVDGSDALVMLKMNGRGQIVSARVTTNDTLQYDLKCKYYRGKLARCREHQYFLGRYYETHYKDNNISKIILSEADGLVSQTDWYYSTENRPVSSTTISVKHGKLQGSSHVIFSYPDPLTIIEYHFADGILQTVEKILDENGRIVRECSRTNSRYRIMTFYYGLN